MSSHYAAVHESAAGTLRPSRRDAMSDLTSKPDNHVTSLFDPYQTFADGWQRLGPITASPSQRRIFSLPK